MGTALQVVALDSVHQQARLLYAVEWRRCWDFQLGEHRALRRARSGPRGLCPRKASGQTLDGDFAVYFGCRVARTQRPIPPSPSLETIDSGPWFCSGSRESSAYIPPTNRDRKGVRGPSATKREEERSIRSANREETILHPRSTSLYGRCLLGVH